MWKRDITQALSAPVRDVSALTATLIDRIRGARRKRVPARPLVADDVSSRARTVTAHIRARSESLIARAYSTLSLETFVTLTGLAPDAAIQRACALACPFGAFSVVPFPLDARCVRSARVVPAPRMWLLVAACALCFAP
jgi:hypothetical protein